MKNMDEEQKQFILHVVKEPRNMFENFIIVQKQIQEICFQRQFSRDKSY